MPKLRKQRKRKVFRHNVNRKRLRNKISDLGNIGCKEIKNQWEAYKSVKTNLANMGLSYDPNVTITIPKARTASNFGFLSEPEGNTTMKPSKTSDNSVEKLTVADAMEAEAKAPRAKLYRLPKGQVQWITFLMDKYGEDYKAMVRDQKNHNQETWKQLRQKIKRFQGIPDQYNKYLAKKTNQNCV